MRGRGVAASWFELPRVARRLAVGAKVRFRARVRRRRCRDAARIAKVRFFVIIAAIRAQGRLSQLSAINRHNRQLFDLLVGAQQDRWGYCKAERHGGPAVHDHLEPGRDQQVFILAETGERLDRTDIRFGLAQDRGSRSDKRGLAL